MGGTEFVCKPHEILPVNYWIRECSRGQRKSFRVNAQILKQLVFKSGRVFAVKSFYERHAFVSGYFFVSYLLRRVIGSPPDTEFGKCGVIMQVVYFIVNAVVLPVRA